MREYKADLLLTKAQPLTLTHATPAPVTSQKLTSIPQLTPLGLVHLGFHFGCVVMRFVEV